MEKSPCVRICALNADRVCIGCGRNAYEIQNWSNFSDEIKKIVKSALANRLEVMLTELRKNKMDQ